MRPQPAVSLTPSAPVISEFGLSSGPFVVHPHEEGWAVASVDEVLMVTTTESEALQLAADAAAILARSWRETPRRAAETRSFAPREED